MAMIDKYCKTPKQYLIYTMITGNLIKDYERLSHFKQYPKVRIIAQPFRDINNPHQVIPQWQKDMARWAMRREYYTTTDFKDFSPRKGFICNEYFKDL